MLNEMFLALGLIAIVTVLGFVGAVFHKGQFRHSWFLRGRLLYVVYVVYEALLTRGFYLLPNLPADAHWNWLGKILALAGTLAIAALPGLGYARSGLTLRQNKGSMSAALVVLAVFAVLFAYLALIDGEGPGDPETIAFQWTMPGLDEELFYRGILLLAMNEAFRARLTVFGAPIGYGGLLTSVLFGLAHALGYGPEGFNFDPMTFALTGVPSLLLLWLRERTGSVALPVIAHNMANGIPTLF